MYDQSVLLWTFAPNIYFLTSLDLSCTVVVGGRLFGRDQSYGTLGVGSQDSFLYFFLVKDWLYQVVHHP